MHINIYIEQSKIKNLIFSVKFRRQSNNNHIFSIFAITLEPDHQKSWFLDQINSINHLYLTLQFSRFYLESKIEGFAQLRYYEYADNMVTVKLEAARGVEENIFNVDEDKKFVGKHTLRKYLESNRDIWVK